MIIALSLALNKIINLLMKSENHLTGLLASLIILFLTFPPQNPVSDTPISPIFQGKWKTQEAERISNRSVAPKYKIAYDYLAQISNPGDIVIATDGLNYLKPINGVTYYGINLWNQAYVLYEYTKNHNIDLQKMESDNGKYFFDVLKDTESGEKLIWIGANIHLIDKDISDYLLERCVNHGVALNIFHYEYSPFYRNKNTTWPNVFVCQK